MKKYLKHLLESVAPSLLDFHRSIQNHRSFGQRFRSLHRRAQQHFFQAKRIEVLSGPFKGLGYLNEIVWGPITPKWLGSYELELHDIVEEIIGSEYAVIINIGCAEGYYAAGLAYRIPAAQVYAYDVDFLARRQTKRLARLNGLESRVSVRGYCTPSEIARRAAPRTLVVCDIEGFERSLLDPVYCPTLLQLDLLVEIHEGSWSTSTLELVTARFSASHGIREIIATKRQGWILSAMNDARLVGPPDLLREAVDEHRTNGQKWLWMKAKKYPGQR